MSLQLRSRVVTPWRIETGNCLDILPRLVDASVESVVCDPPYGYSREPDMGEVLRHWLHGDDYEHVAQKGMMGKMWDSFVPGPSTWAECLRVLVPGGHLVAFGGPRTYDLLATAIRLAGFEIRDSLHWLHGQGWNKQGYLSLQLERKLTRQLPGGRRAYLDDGKEMVVAPPFRHPDADRVWGIVPALKPAHEPIILARKPLIGTSLENAVAYRTAGLYVDRCRVGSEKVYTNPARADDRNNPGPSVGAGWSGAVDTTPRRGRFPSNLLLSHDPRCRRSGVALVSGSKGGPRCVEGCPCRSIGEQSGERKSPTSNSRSGTHSYSGGLGDQPLQPGYADTGTAARFYPQLDYTDLDDDSPFRYVAKPGRAEKDRGLDFRENLHVSVKPVTLLRWLCRLVTPAGGLVLDPFSGSGSCGVAAVLEGFRYFGVELGDVHADVGRRRIAHYAPRPRTLRDLYRNSPS